MAVKREKYGGYIDINHTRDLIEPWQLTEKDLRAASEGGPFVLQGWRVDVEPNDWRDHLRVVRKEKLK